MLIAPPRQKGRGRGRGSGGGGGGWVVMVCRLPLLPWLDWDSPWLPWLVWDMDRSDMLPSNPASGAPLHPSSLAPKTLTLDWPVMTLGDVGNGGVSGEYVSRLPVLAGGSMDRLHLLFLAPGGPELAVGGAAFPFWSQTLAGGL